MERINTLIDKLYQQKAQGASAAHLLFTVQLLQQELTQLQARNGSFQRNKISVTLPLNLNFSEEAIRVPFDEVDKEKEVFVLDTPVIEEEPEAAPVKEEPMYAPKAYTLQKPSVPEVIYTEPAPVAVQEPAKSFQPAYYNPAFETTTEAPTLPFTERRELHQVIAEKKESLNDRLKNDRTEVAHLIKETPIKDLRKGIGINDKFTLVRELFRDDEAMYERSLKTINGFNIYSEAEYWIARELKHKLGWDDSKPTVQHFYQLVRRRFS